MKKKEGYLEQVVLDLAGQLNERGVTESHASVFFLYKNFEFKVKN